ncbi:uncharacterized protein LOC6572103 [Drosophila mojavensis]|uniref:SAYSvFN domain-containing protein n=1 Tax=Drosophila mojavensis TaxID=7230 RepID=B4KCA7_DROMO|nr:uncharacterized protein LOC6572103 [Drosophila mojavensis]EDW13716.1 uncharacterized protein Dmoj_GI23864 [Drosophila mojavensis]
MADFQEQLKNYRQQKQKERLLNSFKLKLKRFWMLGTGADATQGKCQTTIEVKPASDKSSDINDTPEEYVSSDDEIEASHRVVNASEDKNNKCLKYTLWAVYFLFWVTLYVIAIELKFGLVFLMFSALFGIYFNTRTGPKDPNEISAYSIFNKNCESIDGTLKAEQFEREIRYGSGSVR